MSLRIELLQHDNITIFRPIGWVGLENHHLLDERMKAIMDKGNRRIVIDLSQVHFVSSTGLGVFLYYRHVLEDRGGCLLLAAPSAEMWKMLSSARLTQALQVCATLKDALAKAGRSVGSGRLEPVES